VGFGLLVARRLGTEVRDRLVEPLLGGVYAGRSDEISTYAAVPQLLPAVAEHGSLLAAARAVSAAAPGASTPVFAGITGGVGRLAQAVAADITARGGSLFLNRTVRGLSFETSGWRVTSGPTTAERSEPFDAVVVAVPAAPAARLLGPDVPDAARELRAVEYASMAVVTLAYRSRDVDVTLTGTGFLVPPVDGRAIKAATYSSHKWAWQAGDATVVRCSVGRHREEELLQREDRDLTRAAALDLRKATGLTAEPIDAQVTRWGGALPQYAVGHLDRVRRVRDAVGRVSGLAVCGAAYDGVGVAAVVGSGQAAATRVVAALGPAGTMGS
jgi:oxygen-dependent protoporphyrinogen oxidase